MSGTNIINIKSNKSGRKSINRKFHTHIPPTGVEKFMKEDELIVSKTDLKGNITYANDIFLRMAEITEEQAIGAPHSIIRHPNMPRCVFKFLWDRISVGIETFAYVINYAANGDHYWVFAHITPTYDANNNIIGYHSNRRKPNQSAINTIAPIYKELVAIENSNPNAKDGMNDALNALVQKLKSGNISYEQFVFAIAA